MKRNYTTCTGGNEETMTEQERRGKIRSNMKTDWVKSETEGQETWRLMFSRLIISTPPANWRNVLR